MSTAKKILIPTDFSIASLNIVRAAVDQSDPEEVDIILAHGFYMPTSITELLLFSKAATIQKLQNTDFVDACRLIRNKYQSRIQSLYVELVLSSTRAYMENFLESNQVSEIYIPESYQTHFSLKGSFDLVPRLKKSTVRVTTIDWSKKTNPAFREGNHLSDLFL